MDLFELTLLIFHATPYMHIFNNDYKCIPL